MTPTEVINAIEVVANPLDTVRNSKQFYGIELVIGFGIEGALGHSDMYSIKWEGTLFGGQARGMLDHEVGRVDISQNELSHFEVLSIEIDRNIQSGWSLPVVRAVGHLVK